MASYIQITFDRTRPEIEIFAPNYTTREVINTITIEANEPLSTYQEFYIEDSQGGIHNYTFLQSEPHIFTGRVRMNNMPYGISKLFAKVRDEVDNESNLVMATIELKESHQLIKMEESHSSRPVTTSHRIHKTKNEERETLVVLANKSQPVKTSERTQRIITKESRVEVDSD